MAAKLPVAALLLLSALFVCVFAQQNEELSLLELTRGFKGTTVKPSSYGGYTVIQSCLELSQVHRAAYCGPDTHPQLHSCIFLFDICLFASFCSDQELCVFRQHLPHCRKQCWILH